MVNVSPGFSKIAECIDRFLCRKIAYGGNLASDGDRLYSYLVVIAEWDEQAIRLPEANRFYNRTISKHRNMLRDMATARGIPLIEVCLNNNEEVS